ncbi:MAG: methionine--tRNA ligase [Chloroflexi bacterium]|nr:methionine--tRNA ligase [Chloroflexota bacterium]
MVETVFIGVAWPYANGPLHLGHVAGCFLAADIFARYHRAKGDRVLMVSGTDQHGTPITLRAELEKRTPQEVVAEFHASFQDCWRRLGISWDLYTSTGTPNHARVVHDLFLTLLERGYIYPGAMPLAYCPKEARFLPDRYVEGTCPHCGYNQARGDQCDKCGRTLNPEDLRESHCKLCGATPETRQSRHFFLRLSAFNQKLLDWVRPQTHWRPNVHNFTQRYLEQGLQDRAITRDLEWGVAVPVSGYENKRIYVWFEAVTGYLSATQEWAQRQGDPEAWRQFWEPPARSYYFIGKDNIPFHTLIWPAMLMAYGGLALPHDVPANEFLTLEGRQFSTSRNWAIWLPDYLNRYDPDPLRYYLSAGMPETSDADFTWSEFLRRNNDELVATYGNLAQRVLTFTQRHYQGQVPEPGPFDDTSQRLFARAQESLDAVDRHLAQCHFRDGVREAMALAQEANRYLEETAPWRAIAGGPQAAATSVYVGLSVVSCLKTMLYPYLPFSSEELHQQLGFPGTVHEAGWRWQRPSPGQRLGEPHHLFRKLDDTIVEAELGRMAASVGR